MSRCPRLWRPADSRARLELRLPYQPGNRAWLHQVLGARIQPHYHRRTGRWRIARPHLRLLVDELADRFGAVEVVLDFRLTERCDTRCQEAAGDECTCSCLGVNHGGAAYWKQWRLVGETTLVLSGGRKRRELIVTA